jgi:signal transduction histidine kinase
MQSRQERIFVAIDQELTQESSAKRSVRELRVAGEIARAFVTAKRPTEVYRLALERVAPLVGASFACVFLLEEGTDLLQIVSAYNWPQRYAGYLGSMRVRPGNGPTGRAVENATLVDVEDVFADAELEDWWESARELGFKSSIALPLSFESHPVGALTFYFRDVAAFREADRHLLRLVADQLAATAEKAHLIEDLQKANTVLREQNLILEERYREAEEAKRLKNEFLATVSHELRTPLTAILGYTFLLREGVTGDLREEQSAAVGKIEDAGGQLLSLIDGLLDLTSLKLGKVRPEPELCDAGVLARTAVDHAGEAPASVELRVEIPDDRVPVHTDPMLVLRVLSILLSNALKFTRTGTVTLRVGLEDPEPTEEHTLPRAPTVVWEVVDTGIGIAAEYHEVIFDEFRQADGSATRRFGGAGLGLAVGRGLARCLGGDIRLESDAGAGSCFRFLLPSSVLHAGAS